MDISIPSGMLRTIILPKQPETQAMATPGTVPGVKDLGQTHCLSGLMGEEAEVHREKQLA